MREKTAINQTASTFFILDHANATLRCESEWTLAHLMTLKKAVQQLSLPHQLKYIDIKNIRRMDSSGALVLQELVNLLTKQGYRVELKNVSAEYKALFELVNRPSSNWMNAPALPRWRFLAHVGKLIVDKSKEFKHFLAFVGELVVIAWHVLLKPRRMPWRSCVSVFETAGVNALPIIALLSFLIGGVLAYQVALQLRHYGANIYVVDLLGLSVLREFAPLMTAIIVAGRTGSAFTAQLGTMKIRQEIDALRTMGIPPGELLVLPKIIGLLVVLPLLTVWSSIFALLGGMVASKMMLSINYPDFLHRFYEAISVRSYYAGMIKAPVFGVVIAAIGCFQGMQVSGSATSVGFKTTHSVVQAIFFIIVLDALFSIVFNWVGL